MSENTTNNNYTPLSYLMKMEDLPEFLQFIKGGMEQMFGNLYYKDHRTFKSTSGSIAYHKLNIVSQNRLDWEIPGTGMSLVLNPSHTNNTISEFPITLFWEWKILQYFRGFNLKQFAGSPKELFELAIGVLGISKIDFAKQVMRVFVEPSGGKSYLQQFADDLNLNYNFSNEEDPFSKLEEIIDGIDIYAQAFMYYVSQGSITEIKEKIGELFASLLPDDIIKYILNLVKPKAQAMLQLSAGLEFPENILKPMDNNGNVLEGQKVMLTLDGISLLVDTETGFEIENDIACSLSNAQIGNTGFEISFEKLKLDLSKNRNIAEADAEGRPKEFMGAYIESAAINLPRKWFDNSGNQPLSLIGERLLIGTGGFSGTVGMVGTTTKWVRLGGDKGFEIGFNSFDITFKQNSVVDSNIRGILRIPNFTPPNSSSSGLEIEVIGHISGDGDFNLTASVESGISATLFEKVMFTFYSLELGREDSVFYIGTSCDISFKTDSVVTQIMGSDTIPIPKLRIYSNGSIEIVGGTIPVPSSLSLNLGPAKVGVTGINFGSYEGLDSSGTRQRKYNYFGFDGAISVDPLGLDVRGEGLKYYYAVDNAGNDADSFFRIQTISMDLVLPGNVSPEKAMVIIKGMLSIPSPGESKEYAGEISLKLPKIGIAASAQMRLAPKYPAFIVDASVDLPAPIPIGPIGIYGFRALLGYNYVAEKEAVGLVSGKDTWYDYYVHAPKGINIKKFSGPDRASSYKAPISLGAGVVVGTSFDNAKIISVRAMMVLSLPSVFMIDGRATILKDRLGLDPNDTPPFFAMLAWGDNSVELGMGADLKINKDNTVFLTVDARVEAMFPLKNASGWYVNAGTEEKPIQASLFPDLMTLRVQAYLMLSAQGFKTAARADFELDKKFFGVHVYIYAFAEVGAHISFERPQFGGHLHLGGGIDVNVWKIFYLGFDLNVYLAAEVSKPARIGAKLNFAGRLKLLFINVDFNVDVNLEWEKEKDVDLNAIAPIPTDASTAKTMVKGVHMVTNESFELDYFSSEPAANAITAVIPADSFIDIKSAKPLAKTDLNGKIIDFAMVTTGKELIPPVGTTKNGKKLRQVTHQYQIEEITIKADDGRGTWQTYHPYKAMLHNGTSANDLPYGSWQIRGEQRDTIRLLDSNPFSYLNPGEPNWITPDFLGITPKKIFCPENTKLMRCIDVSNKNAGTKYYYKGEAAHHINGAYFRLENFYQGATHPDDPVTPNILQVINDPYTSRSLNFSNYNSLVIILPEDSVSTSLTLGSCAETVKVKYYSKTLNQVSGEYDYILAREDVLRHLQAPYIASYNETTPICMIVVEPQAPNIDLINSLRDEIENLKNDPMFREYPDGRMEQLQIELYAVLQDNCCQCDPNNYSYGSRCGTSFYSLCWLSVKDHEYNSLIQQQAALNANKNRMIDAVYNHIQPIWRPETAYYIHVRMSDTVSEKSTQKTTFNYYFGFKTAKTLGHFQSQISNAADRKKQEDMYNSLEKYIDFKRSYPNADGNLLQAKPLFWGSNSNALKLFFTELHAFHLLKKWPKSSSFNDINMGMDLSILDPVVTSYPGVEPDNSFGPRPKPSNMKEGGLSAASRDLTADSGYFQNDSTYGKISTAWETDPDVRQPASQQMLEGLISSTPNNCKPQIGTKKGFAFSTTIDNLKPLKLYTAIVRNKYGSESKEIHKYVFQTSRYESFADQINSYIVEKTVENNVTTIVRSAVYPLPINCTSNEVSLAARIVNGVDTPIASLDGKYSDKFDRVLEGIMKIQPLDVAERTEFNLLRLNNATRGILIRCPEPFNDPKTPASILAGSIVVPNGYKVLYSKDCSQAIVMKSDGSTISGNSLALTFRYLLWNGTEYAQESAVAVNLNINI